MADLPSWEHLDGGLNGRSDIAGSIMQVIYNILIDLMETMARVDQKTSSTH